MVGFLRIPRGMKEIRCGMVDGSHLVGSCARRREAEKKTRTSNSNRSDAPYRPI